MERGKLLNVLFVCSKNRWRSPTAEQMYARDPRIRVRSRGTSASAQRSIKGDDLNWADLILVMEHKHKQRLTRSFPNEVSGKELVVLEIPDEYQFMDSELIEMISASVEPLIDQRAAGEP